MLISRKQSFMLCGVLYMRVGWALQTILDVLTTTREGGKLEGVTVELDMTGELPAILRRILEKQNAVEKEEGRDLGRVRTR